MADSDYASPYRFVASTVEFRRDIHVLKHDPCVCLHDMGAEGDVSSIRQYLKRRQRCRGRQQYCIKSRVCPWTRGHKDLARPEPVKLYPSCSAAVAYAAYPDITTYLQHMIGHKFRNQKIPA